VLGPVETRQLQFESGRLKILYSEHIQVEEAIVFAHSAKVLDIQTILPKLIRRGV
jgi:hypothetical protein